MQHDMLLGALRDADVGEVRADRLSRALYATDASMYEIVPDAVVLPRTVADVATCVRLCSEYRVPLTARGAGTGLTGGTVNTGIQLDCSRYLDRVLEIDPAARVARVEPGVVLDEVNQKLAEHNLHFAPDVATSSRATIGGMIANNSAGARSVRYGRTCDHVLSVDVVLSDGSRVTWGPGGGAGGNALAQRCEQTLREIVATHRDEIAARYPRVLRSNGGYALDRVDPEAPDPVQLICGSEGTLGVVVGATLRLEPRPAHKGLVVLHFNDMMEALAAVPLLLALRPAAIELIDDLILNTARENVGVRARSGFLVGEPAAILVVEQFAETPEALDLALRDFVAAAEGNNIAYARRVLRDPGAQDDVWTVRKAGLGLLMSKPGGAQPYAFIEDAAVPPDRLHDYIARLRAILREERVPQAGYYAHASVGLLHVRPVLDLRDARDIKRMRRIAKRTSDLVREFGGAMTGEHGDGIVRSEWLEQTYGPTLTNAFRTLKQTFDPNNILNPHKIVDPLPMDEQLRYGAEFAAENPDTLLDFSAHGGIAGLAGMCSGVGQCRQRLVGTMCPSYQGTHDEAHTTRARANALRLALANRALLDGLADPALDEVFDLCLSCKACKTECPTGTDVAKLKAEWLHARNERIGVPRRSRLIARSVALAPWGSRFAPLSNWIMQNGVVRRAMEWWYGLDRRVPPPRFARPSFSAWFRRRGKVSRSAPRGRIAYFCDTWTNYYTPSVGIATVRVLEALGYDVVLPNTVCCGRPLISKGLLAEAQRLGRKNVAVLAPLAAEGVPIVASEPSCWSVLVDELPELVRTEDARRIAQAAMRVEAFIANLLAREPDALRFRDDGPPVLFHGHCHEKAHSGSAATLALLERATYQRATELNTGCCGMAGAFGHEREHYEVARSIGDQRLFPAVRARGDAEIAVTGFSCRHQIEHHTDAAPRHVLEFVAERLADAP